MLYRPAREHKARGGWIGMLIGPKAIVPPRSGKKRAAPAGLPHTCAPRPHHRPAFHARFGGDAGAKTHRPSMYRPRSWSKTAPQPDDGPWPSRQKSQQGGRLSSPPPSPTSTTSGEEVAPSPTKQKFFPHNLSRELLKSEPSHTGSEVPLGGSLRPGRPQRQLRQIAQELKENGQAQDALAPAG